MARLFILAGIILVVIGVVLHTMPWLLNWFGRLPGDIRYESGGTRVFFPLTSMILVSVILTLLVNLFSR